MTNEEVIMRESIELVEQGKLALSDDLPEPIHTYQGWKSMGFKVKKGEHAIAKFAIWTPVKQKRKDDDADDDKKPKMRMYLETACWFKSSQVEEIK